jgi:uncharacterized membrane protein HdeD (DUF308 family)
MDDRTRHRRTRRIALGIVLVAAGVAAMVVMLVLEPAADSAGTIAAYWAGPAVALVGVRQLVSARAERHQRGQ